MSFQPYMYNRPSQTRLPRESEPLMANNIYPSSKLHDSMGAKEQQQLKSAKNTAFKPYLNNNQNSSQFSRVVTEPSIPHPQQPFINQHKQLQPTANYQKANQSKTGPTELFKSSIYAGQSYPQSYSFTQKHAQQKASLNLSGGKPMTPARKLPRVSEPSLPSDMQQYTEYMKGANSNTLNSDNQPLPQTENERLFNKVKPSETKSGTEGHNPSQNTMRRSSVDLSELFFKPEGHKVKTRKWKVDDFINIKELGSGKYGRVNLVREKESGYVCALKCVEKKLLVEQEITQQFIRELKIQMFLNHPHIIKLFGFFEDKEIIYLILQVGTGGQLFHLLKKQQTMPENKVATIMRQVCDAVREIHSLRIIHRDIKPENIVLHDNVIKLCDFGWSVHQDNSLRTTFCGTPLYVCPEILKGREYDEKIDIWSLGIMMYEMLVGENPFKITKEEELIKIIKDEIVVPSYVSLSRQARDFLDKCLKKNPNERVTIRQLMEHDFFKKYPDKQSKMMGL